MSKTAKSKRIQKGFKRIPETSLAINKLGTVYNIQTGHTRKPKTVITPQYGRIITEKAILWVFAGEEPRSGQIMHLDGQKSNKSLENIKYATPEQYTTSEKINISDLRTTLGCYFSLDRKHKPLTNQLETKLCLKTIAEKRAFHKKNQKGRFYGVFMDWLTNHEITPTKAAEMHRISHRAAKNVINYYINRLTAETCNDLKAGLLKKQPFLLTQRERRKKETKALHEFGIKRPAPFRVPSDISGKFQKLGIEHPTAAEINKLCNLSTSSKMLVWFNLARKCLKDAPIEYNETKIKERVELSEMISRRIFDLYDSSPNENL